MPRRGGTTRGHNSVPYRNRLRATRDKSREAESKVAGRQRCFGRSDLWWLRTVTTHMPPTRTKVGVGQQLAFVFRVTTRQHPWIAMKWYGGGGRNKHNSKRKGRKAPATSNPAPSVLTMAQPPEGSLGEQRTSPDWTSCTSDKVTCGEMFVRTNSAEVAQWWTK